jgi:hypothetical protein
MGPTNAIIQDCFIANNGYIGLDLRECYGHAFVRNCGIIANKGSNGGGICADCYLTVENSLIVGNHSESNGGAIVFYQPLNLKNCTIVGNSADWGYVVSGNGYTDAIIENCIIRNNFPDSKVRFRGNRKNFVNYCNIEGGINSIQFEESATLNWGPGNIDIDPCFIEPCSFDYHLLAESPCINAGDPNYIPEPNETDLDGNPRINGGRIDMGAYEPIMYETRLLTWPQTINSKSHWPKTVMAWMCLPQGITKEQVDGDTPIILYPGGIEAVHQFVTQNYRGHFKRACVFALFNKAELIDVIDTNGKVQIMTFGHMLKSGQYFYGRGNIRIISWPALRPQIHKAIRRTGILKR